VQPNSPATDQPIVNVVGEKVALGPVRRDLMPLYDRWFNGFEVGLPYFLQLRPHTREAREAWYERLARDEPDTVEFLIYERATLRPIGKTALDYIDHYNRTASFGILIGEKDCWGKGYGTETTILMLDYAFTLLGLHNVMVTVDGHNERAIRAYRRAGFRELGRRRGARRRGNRTFDDIYMDCIATEFRSPLLHRLLPNETGER
jgi:RimJ/RimL family protein N-acetyltransferase